MLKIVSRKRATCFLIVSIAIFNEGLRHCQSQTSPVISPELWTIKTIRWTQTSLLSHHVSCQVSSLPSQCNCKSSKIVNQIVLSSSHSDSIPRTMLVLFAVNLFAGMFGGFKLAEVADKPRGTSWCPLRLKLLLFVLRGISVCKTLEK